MLSRTLPPALKPATPWLEPAATSAALEAMRLGRPLGPAHPLAQFIGIQRPFDPAGRVGGTAAEDYRVFRTLVGLIRRRLNQHRQLHGLPPVSRTEGTAALVQDFQIGSVEMEVWSLLNFRYVRVDLDLPLEQISRLANQTERTLNRRQQVGVTRLTQDLIRLEVRARARQREAALRSRLPSPLAPRAVGRVTLLDEALAALSDQRDGQPRHVLLHGPPGVGKSTLALALAHRLIDAGRIQNLAWLALPESALESPEALIEAIGLSLGMPNSLEDRPSLSTYLQLVETVLILDDAQPILDRPALLEQVLPRLAPARLVLCAPRLPDPGSAALSRVTCLSVPDLDRAQAFELLDLEARRLGRPAEPEAFSRLYDEVGGNPGALRMAFAAGRRFGAAEISWRLFEPLWRKSNEPSRLVWIVFALTGLPADPPTVASILNWVSADALVGALVELENGGVLEAARAANQPTAFHLTRLALALARSVIARPEERERVGSVVRAVADYLAENPVPTACLHLLENARRSKLASSLLLDMAYTFAPIVEKLGAWIAWSQYLEGLQGFTEAEDRLWVTLRLGVAYRWLAHWPEAAYCLTEVAETAGRAGLFAFQADALTELGTLYRLRGEFATARDLLERAARFYQRAERSEALQRVSAEMIQAALDSGDLPAAQDALLGSLPGPFSTPRWLGLAAQVALRSGRLPEALDLARRSATALGTDLPRLGRAAALVGQIQYRLGEHEAAVEQMKRAIHLMSQTHDLLGHARGRLNLAMMYMGQGRLRLAMRTLRDLPAEMEQLGDAESLRVVVQNLETLQRLASNPRVPPIME